MGRRCTNAKLRAERVEAIKKAADKVFKKYEHPKGDEECREAIKTFAKRALGEETSSESSSDSGESEPVYSPRQPAKPEHQHRSGKRRPKRTSSTSLACSICSSVDASTHAPGADEA